MWILTKFVNDKSITIDSHLGRLAQMAFYATLSVHPENLYDALIRAKSLVNCDTHFAENLFNRLFQTGFDFDLKKRRFCIMIKYKESMYWLYRFRKAMVSSL